MRPIDEKIVKMRMDNSDFKSKASETVGIFGKLNSAFTKVPKMAFGGIVKGFGSIASAASKVTGISFGTTVKNIADVGSAANKVDMSQMAQGVEQISSRFSAMGMIAQSVLENITNRVTNLAMELGQKTIFGPLMEGFQEYELKMGSIQTILANTARHGTGLEEVTAALDELNLYADKTIYNFGDMTRNIGLFTNAGIKVDDATSMIKGFSNAAAASGTSSSGAANAAYQLSQAMSAGTIRLMDWRSLSNVGMGNKNMQNDLISLAGSMGDLETAGVSAESVQKDFNGSLESGWLSADVMGNYLKIMANEMTDAEMAALGLSTEQIKGMKETAATAEESATKVRTLTQLIGTAGEALGSGWSATFDILFGDFNEATEMFTKANDAISKIIDSSSKARNDLIKGFDDLGGRKALIDIITNAFTALMQVIEVGKGALEKVFPPMTAQKLFEIVEAVKEFTEGLKMNEETAKKVGRVFEGFFSIFSIVIEVAKTLGEAIANIIPDNAGSTILDFLVKIADVIVEFKDGIKAGNGFTIAIEELGNIVKKVADFVWTIAQNVSKFIVALVKGGSEILNVLGPTLSKIGDFMGELIGTFDIEDALSVGFIGAVIGAFKKFDSLTDSLGGFVGGLTDMFGDIGDAAKNLGGITEALEAMTTNIKVSTLVSIAAAVTLLAISMKLIAGLDAQDIAKSLQVIAVTLVALSLSLSFIGKLDFTGGGTFKAVALLVSISAAVLVLSGALKLLSTVDEDDMSRSLAGLVVIVGALVAAMVTLGTFSGKILTSSASMVALSVSVVILATAVERLSKIKGTSLAKALGGLGVMLLELAVFLKIVDQAKLKVSSAVSVVVITGAILVMVEAIEQISDIPVKQLIKGLGVITVILAEIAIFVKMTAGAKVMSAALGMATVAAAINMLVGPIGELGAMDMGQLAQGLIAMTLALAAVVAAMTLAQGGIGGAVAILLVANAISVLVPPLVALGNLSLGQVAIALGALAGAFIVIGIAAAVLSPLTPALLAFALSLGAIGLAVGAVGIVLLGFGAILTTLAGLTVAGIASIVGALSLLLLGLTSLIPQAVNFVVTLFVEMAQGVAEAAPVLAQSIATAIMGIVNVLPEFIPDFVDAVLLFLTNMALVFTERSGPLIDAAVEMVITLVNNVANALRENDEAIVGAVLNTIGAILEAIVTAMVAIIDILWGWIPGVSDTAAEMGESAKQAIGDTFTPAEHAERGAGEFIGGIEGGKDGANAAGTGLAYEAKSGAGTIELKTTGDEAGLGFNRGVGGRKSEARTTGTGLATNTKSGAGSISLNTTGRGLGSGFNQGVAGKQSEANTKGKGLATNARSGAGSVSLRGSGSDAGQGFANGISSKHGIVETAAKGLANAGKWALEKVLAIFSPSRVLRKDGGFFGEGFALGITDQEGNVSDKASQMAQGAVDAVRSYAETFSDAMLDQMDLNPTITPVMDLSNIDSLDLPNRLNVGNLRVNGIDTTGVDKMQGNSSTSNTEYNIHITANGDLPQPTIKKMAKQIQTEIKNQNDRQKFSRGEPVMF